MKHILFILSFTVFSIGSAQTSGVLSGKILDAELYNEPLLMASLTLKNTSWKAQTNFNGNFEITAVAPGKYTLQIAFLGYETLEMPVEIKEGERLEILEALKAKSFPVGSTEIVAETANGNTTSQISGFKK